MITAPASGTEGLIRYTCTVCARSIEESIPALPEKMSEDEWLAAFIYDNVRIDGVSSMDGYGESSVVILIDGENAEVTSDGETYLDSSENYKGDIDFSLNYADFEHLGNGIYAAESVTVSSDMLELELTGVIIVFADGCVESISYSLDMLGIDYSVEYTFSEWGNISIEVPGITEEEYAAAINEDMFANYTLDMSVYGEDYSITSTVCYFDGESFCVYTCDDLGEENYEYGTLENAGVVMNPYLGLLAELDAADLVYDSSSFEFAYVGELTDTDIVYLGIGIEDGVLNSISIVYSDGSEEYVIFYDYGITSIE